MTRLTWRKFDANPATATRHTRRQPVRWVGSLDGKDLWSAHYSKLQRAWWLINLRSAQKFAAMDLKGARKIAEERTT